MISQKIFLGLLEKVRCNQSNYQKLFLEILVKAKGKTVSMPDIAEYLHANNSGYELEHYQRKCPVYRVVCGKLMTVADGDGYKLNTRLNEDGLKQARKIIKGMCSQ